MEHPKNCLIGCWRIERLLENGISFTTNQHFDDESGYFIVKRAPIGGGAWSRNRNSVYSSSSSTLDSQLSVSDKSSTVTTVSSGNQSVIWKRNFKRNSSHYLGEDIDFNTAHWTIVGDHLRFVLVIAYKQNPRTHSRILVFGDIVDVNDDKLKTILVGYTNDKMGDVGFNKIFEYPIYSFSDKGILQLGLKSHQPSGIGWIYSNSAGEVDYLHGTRDCGQHQYPIPYPST
jgi:hypothetical protein